MAIFDEVAPGNMVLVEGDERVKTWLRTEDSRVDDWLYQVVDGLVFYAAGRMKERAPGGIKELVDVDLVDEKMPHYFEGIAGVEPDITEESFGRGLGSDPADYPVFVEVGTGVFGPVGEPISTMNAEHLVGLMGPIDWNGHQIWVTTVQGQRPQRYAEQSHEDLIEHTPVYLRAALPELGRQG